MGCIVTVTIEGGEHITKLAEVRKAKGLTQERLSELSGVARVTIARCETGKTVLNVRTLKKLANALNVPVGEIVEKAG